MVSCASCCVRRLAQGRRRDIVGIGRLLANEKVNVGALTAGWSVRTAEACEGRHVLAIQDTSEIHFRTSDGRERGLGKVGQGNIRGVLLHAMMAVDAGDGACLGLVAGDVWTRAEEALGPHRLRPPEERESARWIETAEAAERVLARAAMITVVGDRESDIFALLARPRAAGVHLLVRASKDRRVEGGQLSDAPTVSAGLAHIALRERPDAAERTAHVEARHGRVRVRRPDGSARYGLPAEAELTLLEVAEHDAPEGETPILWRLLTTHEIACDGDAWRIVGWYRQRWAIEQLFRTLKSQGLRLEDSQVADADRLIKLTAVAAHAACIVMQLVHARDGASQQPADIVFSQNETAALEALIPELEGRTQAQKNPHRPRSLAWAAWVIAKLGGWDGYKSSRPPGPVTFANGLHRFKAIAQGWKLRDV